MTVDRGRLAPWIRPAAGALQALRRGHIEAARDLCAAIPTTESDGEAWHAYVEGMLFLDGEQHEAAEARLLIASGRAEAFAMACAETAPDQARLGLRLSGLCYHQLGEIHRRVGHPDRAVSYHLAAFAHREESGTPEEQWETALSLQLDHSGRDRLEAALQWSLRALALAEQLEVGRARCCAVSWNGVGRTLGQLEKHQEAATAASNARGFWETIGTPAQKARADRLLGEAWLAWAEALRAGDDRQAAQEKLETAQSHLSRALAGFEATRNEAEAASCQEALEGLMTTLVELKQAGTRESA